MLVAEYTRDRYMALALADPDLETEVV